MRLSSVLLFPAFVMGLSAVTIPVAHAFPASGSAYAAADTAPSPSLIEAQDKAQDVRPQREGARQGKHRHKDRPALSEERREKWKNMSPEERAAYREKFKEERRAKWKSMSPEEREAFKGELKQKLERRWRERLDRATPEQQEQMQARRAEWEKKREAIRRELESLPPEERKARMADIRAEFQEKRRQAMEARRAGFQARWEKAGPEDKAAFCAKARERCGEGDSAVPVCRMVMGTCSNQ